MKDHTQFTEDELALLNKLFIGFGCVKITDGKTECPFCKNHIESAENEYCSKCKKCFSYCKKDTCCVNYGDCIKALPCVMVGWESGVSDKIGRIGFGHDHTFDTEPSKKIFICSCCRNFTPTVSADMFESEKVANEFLHYMNLKQG